MVRASTHSTGENQAALHVNYQETVLHIPDGLPKFRDMPAEMGGSGRRWRSEASHRDLKSVKGGGFHPPYGLLALPLRKLRRAVGIIRPLDRHQPSN